MTQKIKKKDLGGIGKELKERKGTGFYDPNRTQYNIEFTPMCSSNLASSVYKTLKDNDVEYNPNNKNINYLNGCVITSGQEFFKALGMQFEDTDKVHLDGEHIGEPIQKLYIKDKEDITDETIEFFKSAHEFMCDYVGKENVVYSAVHFDEQTPHLHFYFTPVVNQVKRKVFETDSNGKQLTKELILKDGSIKKVPIQKKDENGKNIYETINGKFLNSDQFWKEKGGNASFAKLQDDFNEYINKKGFDLDRGNIGDNKYHKTKAEFQIEQLNKEIELTKQELDNNKAINEIETSYIDMIKDVDNDPLLNPERTKILGYKEKDINELSNYSKKITKDNLNKDKEIKQKDILLDSKEKHINKLNKEIRNLKSGKTIEEKDKIIQKQKEIIKEKDETIEYQSNLIDSLRAELEDLKEKASIVIAKVKNVATGLYKALKRTLGYGAREDEQYSEYNYTRLSNKVNKNYEKDKYDDYEL